MKKTVILAMAMAMGISATAMASTDIRNYVGDPGNEIVDTNPTCYTSHVLGGSTYESYIDTLNNVAVTKRDGVVVKTYQIPYSVGDPGNNIPNVNPTCYSKHVVNNAVYESYIDTATNEAVTKRDGEVVVETSIPYSVGDPGINF